MATYLITGVAGFIGEELPEIYLIIDICAIGNFLAIAILADQLPGEIVYCY